MGAEEQVRRFNLLLRKVKEYEEDLSMEDERQATREARRIEAAQNALDGLDKLTPRQRAYQEFMQSTAWKVLRNRRLQLDGYICQDCGGAAVTAHHIYYPEEGAWEETPLWCLVSLCLKCHAKAHRIFPPGSAPWSTQRSYQAANEEDS